MDPDDTDNSTDQPANSSTPSSNPSPKLTPPPSPPKSNLTTVIMIAIATLLAIAGVAIFAVFELTGPTQPISL